MRIAPALRRVIAGSPLLYTPWRQIRYPHSALRRQTDLLIEGMPRSANTWTEAVIRHVAPPHLRLAHHAHAIAQVRQAQRWGVPILVLLRAPEAALSSWMAMYPGQITATQAWRAYLAFYTPLLTLPLSGLLLVGFDSATRHPALVVEMLNARFGLGLDADRMAKPEARHQIEAEMRAREVELWQARGPTPHPATICLPGAATRAEAQEPRRMAVRALNDGRCATLRGVAEDLYDGLLRASDLP